MIDVKIDAHGGISRFDVVGSDLDIAGEIGAIISQVYAHGKSINPTAAEQSRGMISVMLLPESPVWSEPPIAGNGVVSAVIPHKR